MGRNRKITSQTAKTLHHFLFFDNFSGIISGSILKTGVIFLRPEEKIGIRCYRVSDNSYDCLTT